MPFTKLRRVHLLLLLPIQGAGVSALPAIDPAATWRQYSAAWAALEARLSLAKTGGETGQKHKDMDWTRLE
jgi:hypothetical protein